MKRTLAILLVLVLTMGLFTGCQKEEKVQEPAAPTVTEQNTETAAPVENKQEAETQPAEEEGPLLEEPLVIEMVTRNDGSGNDEFIIDLIKKYTNVELQITRLDSFDEQYALLVSDNDIPDVSCISGNYFANQYGPEGAYVNIFEYLDQMPNLKAYLESRDDAVKGFRLNENEMYRIPCIYQGGASNVKCLVYRLDIFEELGLQWPTNREELEHALRTMKEAYPDSYPLAIPYLGNSHMTNIVDLAQLWGTDLTFPGRNNAFCDYDENTETWYQGATSDNMKEMISWMHQMIEEGLLYPTVTAAIADTEALFTAGNAFITYSEFKKIPTLNATGRATDPDFNAAGGAPFAIGDHGVGETFTPSIASYNWAISTQCERLDDVLTYIDWLYSEEGIHVINYGEEGLTYTLDAEGNVVWNEEALASGNPQSYYGLGRECIYGVYDFHAFTSWQEDSFKQTVEDVMPLAVQKRTPSIKKYNEEQQMIADTYGQAYTTFVKSELTKFLVGERDLAEWDNYVKEANETYHGEDLVKIASEAWAAQNS